MYYVLKYSITSQKKEKDYFLENEEGTGTVSHGLININSSLLKRIIQLLHACFLSRHYNFIYCSNMNNDFCRMSSLIILQ